jgi:hypothetical protein
MALPFLYWMLECKHCGTRRVVHDTYLQFVGTSHPFPEPGEGYGGPPLEERYGCTKGCSQQMQVIGAIFGPGDTKMWLHKPHIPVDMDPSQIEEWRRLIREAGFA